MNALLEPWSTPFGVPPFDLISVEQLRPPLMRHWPKVGET